jgi:hypothetical protein
MKRHINSLLLAIAASSTGCFASCEWAEQTSPAGIRCGDLQLVPIGKPDLIPQPARRFRPLYVSGCDSVAECEWALRRKGCAARADIIIDVKLAFGKSGMEGFAARFGAANQK